MGPGKAGEPPAAATAVSASLNVGLMGICVIFQVPLHFTQKKKRKRNAIKMLKKHFSYNQNFKISRSLMLKFYEAAEGGMCTVMQWF